MNGYSSSMASVLSGGVKTSRPCHLPAACLIDLDLLAAAPARLAAAGFGDLMSRSVSAADWLLSQRLAGTTCHSESTRLMDLAFAFAEGVGHNPIASDAGAVSRLAGALIASGLAMEVAGSSAPASGAEHLISHYLDMRHYALGEPHELHGQQVGVAAVAMAALYERFLKQSPGQIDVDGLVGIHADGTGELERIRAHFGPLYHAVEAHVIAKQVSADLLRDRLQTLRRQWQSLCSDLLGVLLPASELRRRLLACGCPVRFRDLGVAPERSLDALRFARHIRARYTILDTAAELGMLEKWTGEIHEEDVAK